MKEVLIRKRWRALMKMDTCWEWHTYETWRDWALKNGLSTRLQLCKSDDLPFSPLNSFFSSPRRPSKHVTNGVTIYQSINDTSKDGFDPSTVAKCCKNNKSHKGYKWQYIDKEQT